MKDLRVGPGWNSCTAPPQSRAHQYGSEFQYRAALSGSGRHRGLHVEECDFKSVFATRTHCSLIPNVSV
jgi:hypothetical protein